MTAALACSGAAGGPRWVCGAGGAGGGNQLDRVVGTLVKLVAK
jgi:hypothetical protein